jgi:hypothetical protein
MPHVWQYRAPLIREDVHGEVRVGTDLDYALLERSTDHEAETKIVIQENYVVNAWLACVLIVVGAFLLWLPIHFVPWREVWADLVWLWNAGPEDSPWLGPARWGVVTGVCCVIWFCAVGAYEWWTRGRR